MNRGLLGKALRECWLGTLAFGVALAVVEALLAFALLRFQDLVTALGSQIPILQHALRAMLGATGTSPLSPEMIGAIAWVHPVPLALVWAHVLIYCTRVPAGEVDRGTIDILLGMPVSRWQLWRGEMVVWLVAGAAILLMGLAGNVLGNLAASGGLRTDARRLGIIFVNGFCLYFAVGGLTWLASAASDRRGRAIAVPFAVVLGSFLLAFLAPLWSPAERVSFLSLLHYYVPLAIIRDGVWPVRDMIVLLACGTALWTAGGLIFARRDLSTL
jgi:hypothetical protein